jgi:glyoxylase-like metal-dependent hydrolase (beta-lactamase superfamily II)
LHDGDAVKLGGTVLTAHKTAGHTRGCTTWTMQVTEAGRPLDVVIVGSWNVNPGWRLVDRPDQPASYPGIAADYRRTFATLKGLKCDVFLGAHGAYFKMLAKLSTPVPTRMYGSTLRVIKRPWRSANERLRLSLSACRTERRMGGLFVLDRTFSFRHCLTQHKFDLRIHAAQIIRRPFLDFPP